MTAMFEELNLRTSATVVAALTRKCEVCKAQPGADCTNTINSGLPLPGRLVHFARMGC
jgi:hypothetical protein